MDFFGNFLDPQSILAQSELVPVKLLIDLPQLSQFNSILSSQSDSLFEIDFTETETETETETTEMSKIYFDSTKQKSPKIYLPLWIAIPLHQQKAVQIQMPYNFSNTFHSIWKSDSTSIKLQKIKRHFYTTGAILAQIFNDENLIDSMSQMLIKRFLKISDLADEPKIEQKDLITSQVTTDREEFIDNLDWLEQSLFQIGKQNSKQYQIWKNRASHKIQQSNVSVKTLKRFRIN
ncbi:hypothetical protein M0811_13317 [Anaeramoeba ignava]|uniref:DNA replication complex GINS protein PSF3 n=1 Tax=Anaeramoeba ignava TaxID=1746090 RepID=A0A9Q0L980_ANAIG|nr:hypothetical protein M0811_13317 [Anaeramoeba ignava]